MSSSKPCKYNCNTTVEWRGKTGQPGSTGFFESETGQEHTYNRCLSLKGQVPSKKESWSGTTKQGQMFEARESKITNTQEANIEMALKILIDVNRNVLEILGILNEQITKTVAVEEPKSAADIAYKEIKEPEFLVKTSEDDSLIADDGEDDDAAKKEREEGDYGF